MVATLHARTQVRPVVRPVVRTQLQTVVAVQWLLLQFQLVALHAAIQS